MQVTVPERIFVDRKNVQLTPEELSLVSKVIRKVWLNIRDHTLADTDGKITNAQAIESCLDNSRPSKYCNEDGDEVETIIDSLLRNYGGATTTQFLNRNISLISNVTSI